jgi:hypothetical protein
MCLHDLQGLTDDRRQARVHEGQHATIVVRC